MILSEYISKYPTKNKEGFVYLEILDLIKNFNPFNREKFEDALIGNTCLLINNEIIYYRWDVEKAVICGIENRNLKVYEWD